MPNNNEGRKAFEDNIIRMKMVGQRNQAEKRRIAEENERNHLAQMEARKQIAAAEAERKRLQGIEKRNAHNEALRRERMQRQEQYETVKTLSLRALE